MIRADDPEQFPSRVAAHRRDPGVEPDVARRGETRRAKSSSRTSSPARRSPSRASSRAASLRELALFDKPDPLEAALLRGDDLRDALAPPEEAQAARRRGHRAAAGAGPEEGPIHAELRWNDAGAWPIEVAARSIGGLCSPNAALRDRDVARGADPPSCARRADPGSRAGRSGRGRHDDPDPRGGRPRGGRAGSRPRGQVPEIARRHDLRAPGPAARAAARGLALPRVPLLARGGSARAGGAALARAHAQSGVPDRAVS